MSETKQAKHTPGAIRAGRNIAARFRKALPNLPESNAETLAAIIDQETAAPDLRAALKEALPFVKAGNFGVSSITAIRHIEAALQKAEGTDATETRASQ